ncbi:hypothetical protein ACJJTC_007400 [Scirpophaga incertulas]
MLISSLLCRCAQSLGAAPNKFLAYGTRKGLTSTHSLITRALYTPVKSNNNKLGTKISELIKSNKLVVRLSSTTPKDQQPTKAVGYWLLGCSGMVFAAVVLGGVTRLTESGLSMVTWKLLGEKLPTTEDQWQREFERYQQYPEFKYKNQSITLSEFKWIWWMEYAHRMWGRGIGAVVLLPAAYWWARGGLGHMRSRVLVYASLVGAQGLMGWYMVKSGLEDRFQGPNDVPRVSQYRLAAHLGLAFVLYAGLLAGALRVLRPAPLAATLSKINELRGLTAMAHGVKAMAFFTAVSGAFVAGLDAGLVYNSFPKMGDDWIPSDILSFNPTLRNFTENPTTVQFDHRVLGTTTLALATSLWMLARGKTLSRPARIAVNSVAAMAWLQVGLGILTLVHFVPTPLAASHQSGSLVLLSLAIWLTHEIKLLKYIPK